MPSTTPTRFGAVFWKRWVRTTPYPLALRDPGSSLTVRRAFERGIHWPMTTPWEMGSGPYWHLTGRSTVIPLRDCPSGAGTPCGFRARSPQFQLV